MLAADRALDQAGAARVAQPQDLPLDRPHRDARGSACPSSRDVDAGRDDDRVGRDVAVAGHAGHALAVHAQARRPAPAQLAVERARERGDELARVDRVVARDVEREPDRGRERRLQPPRLGRAQSLDGQPEAAAELRQAVERLGLVAVARDDERADRAVARVARARRRSPRTGARSPGRARSSARSPNSASETGREHPRGDCHAPGSPASSTTTRAPRCGARHAHARPIAPPPTTATSKLSDLPLRLLPPYAGTTRIRFDGRRPAAPSQPARGLPCSALHGIP